jgi:hypothetical protein
LGARWHQPAVGESGTSEIPARRENSSETIAPATATERETRLQKALEAISDYRTKELGDLFGPSEEGAVTVHMGSGKFGVNSNSRAYTSSDRAAANRLRDALVEKYADLPRGAEIGRFPNNAVYHAETTALLRLAKEHRGSLAGQTLEIHADREMCPRCEEILPRIGLELGNPTVSFIDHTGQRVTMHNGQWLR